jgi:hypothetical protein
MKSAANTKSILLSKLVSECGPSTPYIVISDVKSGLRKEGIDITDGTLRQYMSAAMAKGVVHDAGRGWYSSISEPFNLELRAVQTTIKRIQKAFPLLDFSCWSTQQINPYMHHLLAKFVTFVYADADLIPSMYDELRGWKGYHVYSNPLSAEADRFRLDEKTIVIRPETSEAPTSDVPHAAPIEKILVDLAIEVEKLGFIGKGEFKEMAWRAVTSGRVSMATLLRYARRCGRAPSDMFGENGLTNGTNP